MKVAIVGSRNLNVDISKYLPENTTEIISGGARGVDASAEAYARKMNIPIRIIKPEYGLHKKGAPLKRNEKIVEIADMVIAIWDGKSRGTNYTIDYAYKVGKPIKIHTV